MNGIIFLSIGFGFWFLSNLICLTTSLGYYESFVKDPSSLFVYIQAKLAHRDIEG